MTVNRIFFKSRLHVVCFFKLVLQPTKLTRKLPLLHARSSLPVKASRLFHPAAAISLPLSRSSRKREASNVDERQS